MENNNDGGSAFPLPTVFNEIQGLKYTYETGMTLRDYLAGQVLIGLSKDKDLTFNGYDNTALIAYSMADAMLKARQENAK